MEHILPIGSIIEVRGDRLCVLGARLAEKDGKLVLAYMVTRHPRGLAGEESLGLLLADRVETILFRGQEGVSGKKYREAMEQFYGTLEGRDAEEAKELLELKNLKKAVEQRVKQDESFMDDIGG